MTCPLTLFTTLLKMKLVVICCVFAMALARPQELPQVPGLAEHQAAEAALRALQAQEAAVAATFQGAA